jgi:POT family proton-dependent oligopeptide transporter
LSATFFGHPRGLATLFFTEMWERFTYYGMRAVLVLFLVSAVSAGGFGIDDRTAAAIYGMYTAGTYLVALPGGWIADRLIGARRAVLIGGLLITLGNTLLAASTAPRGFYLGLVVIVLGVGMLKPNVSAMVADLYPEGGARLDAGFTVFYMGINLGATLGPFVTGEAIVLFGPRAGFAAAAVCMALGVVQYHFTQGHLGNAGKFIGPAAANAQAPGTAAQPPGKAPPWRQLWIGVGLAAAVLAACSFGWIPLDPVTLAQTTTALIVAMAVLYFGYLFSVAGLSAEERRRAVVILVLFLGSALFWSGYEQAGSSLNLFAERYTDRSIGWLHFVVPTGWFQSLNPAYIMIFAPAFAWAWVALAKRHLNPSAPAKFAIGVMLMGSGFLIMAAAAAIVAGGSKVLPTWLILTYLLHTFGELCLSPVGLSYFTKLAPKRFVGQLMGMFFLSISLGNLIAGLIAGEFDANNLAAMPGQYMHIVYFSVGLGAVLLILSRPVKKLMGNVQ